MRRKACTRAAGPKKCLILIGDGTLADTTRAEDAADHLVDLLSLLRRLEPLFFGNSGRDKERSDPLYPFEELREVDEEVFQGFERGEWFHKHLFPLIVFHQFLACEPAATVDLHGT